MKKRLSKLLYAIQSFVSKDYTYRRINGIKFDLRRCAVEATDGHALVIVKASRGLVAALANEYADYLGLEPVGGDFDAVKLAPRNGTKFPPEKLSEDDTRVTLLDRVIPFGNQDPEWNTVSYVHPDQFPRLEKFCKALKVTLKLIPNKTRLGALVQYGKAVYCGECVRFCIVQMPMHPDSPQPKTEVSYKYLDELDKESEAIFRTTY